MFRPTVANVIYKRRELLLVRKAHWKDNEWDFVNEGIKEKDGETTYEAAVRGLREELKLYNSEDFGEPIMTDVTDIREFSKKTLAHYGDRNVYKGKSLIYFVVPFVGDTTKPINLEDLGDDLVEAAWFDRSELLQKLRSEYSKSAVEVLRFIHMEMEEV